MILCSGCFDGLHAGHVAYLEAARREGHVLVVAVASDDYIRRVKRREPTHALAERLRVVRALRIVDAVLPHGVAGAADVIRQQRPAVFVKGQDWKRNGLAPDVIDACIDVGCRIEYVDSGYQVHTSTSRETKPSADEQQRGYDSRVHWSRY
jgi:cytidyltransferase-like protein